MILDSVYIYIYMTHRSNSQSPLKTVRFAQFNQAQINVFVRKWIRQKGRAQSEDKNKEEKLKAMN